MVKKTKKKKKNVELIREGNVAPLVFTSKFYKIISHRPHDISD